LQRTKVNDAAAKRNNVLTPHVIKRRAQLPVPTGANKSGKIPLKSKSSQKKPYFDPVKQLQNLENMTASR
jgi:hypothetical protein